MKKRTRILALGLMTSALMGQVAFAAGNHNIQALKLNPFAGKENDAMVVANGIKKQCSWLQI